MASQENNDPAVFSKALEIALKIMEKKNWEKKIEDPEILQRYFTEYYKNLPNWMKHEAKDIVEAPFRMAIDTLATLLEDEVILRLKYVDPIFCSEEALLPEFLDDMKKRIKNTEICGKNLLVHEEPLEENQEDDDLDWLIEEAGTKPDFWDTENHENFIGSESCSTCQSPIIGIYAYCSKDIFKTNQDMNRISACEACYLKGSPNEFVKFCQSRYMLEKLEIEIKRRLRRGQVLADKKQIQVVDEVIPKELHDCFVREMENLELISENDFHPGTGGKVMNLIHPSMYPFLIHHTPYFLKMDPSIPLIKQEDSSLFGPRTSLYQWLPAEVKVDADGCCEFTSYINNLYPDIYPNLYPLLGLIFSDFLPLFEQCLDRPLRNRSLQVIVKASDYILKPGQSYTGNWHVEGTNQENIIASGIYYYDVSEGIKDAGLAFRRQRDYEFDWPSTYDVYSEFLEEILRKCFVKFNIKEGNLQADEDECCLEYGLLDDSIRDTITRTRDLWDLGYSSSVINVGHVETKPGRCIVFSNSLQHKVAGVHVPETEQNSKKRRILCFFLVDPDCHLPSSHSVPPQQQRRTPDEVSLALHGIEVNGHHLPLEICQHISQLAFPRFTLREALEHRLRFMHDRRILSERRNDSFEVEFSLCEH